MRIPNDLLISRFEILFDSTPPPSDASMRDLLKSRVKHVGADYRSFLHHWIHLQLLEYSSANRVDKVIAQISEAGDAEEKEK
ncbi:unnamed protein product [Hydatigera taeniaeformis]|uniref:Uncharacterized protein n=1 Tax=Hydatigena taeniaeformis TaxID=6205 RepID=A0A0R3WWA6_HYDTA|nr:unnamed protein product [Hydatigera taeniaeformis]